MNELLQWVLIGVLYWIFSTIVVDQMVAKDAPHKWQRILIWFLWPVFLPLLGFMYIITRM